jgi:7-keto-8-aminopelargonate synthetase-like enzyme
MTASRTTLPDLSRLDFDGLRALIVSQHEQLLRKDEQLLSREHEIEHLKLLIAKLQRMQFGRKSEKIERQIQQLELKLEELQAKHEESALPAQSAPSTINPPATEKKRERHRFPEHLAHEIETHEPAHSVCPQCGGTLKKLREVSRAA